MEAKEERWLIRDISQYFFNGSIIDPGWEMCYGDAISGFFFKYLLAKKYF
jgi:hypothetical protein